MNEISQDEKFAQIVATIIQYIDDIENLEPMKISGT